MTYTFDLILKKEWRHEYALYSLSGNKVFDIRAANMQQAYEEAVRFMSSWSSVRISVEKNEDDKN